MYLTAGDIRDLDEERLKKFLEKKIPEGHHLDYKIDYERDASGRFGTDAKREFLKDITAFANANGGDLLIGVDEPSENVDIDTQIRGIESCDKLVGILERVARDSVDPPIPGLIVKAVTRSSGNGVILVHIPPSNTRPYRVNHSGYVNFSIRHSESIFSMNTHDIREAVIASASAEAKAREYLKEAERDVEEFHSKGKPCLLLQAMPLIPPENPWDVVSDNVISVIRDRDAKRRKQFRSFPLESTTRPTRTLEGVMGRDDSSQPTFITEIHRNGYISAFNTEPLKEIKTQDHSYQTISKFQFEFFNAFACFCSQMLEATKTDSPYLVKCTLLCAKGIHLYAPELTVRFHGPWLKPTLQWPDQIRQTGEDFERIATYWSETLYHAFGLDLRLTS
jgi:Putative DNA-binding domain